MKLRISVCLIGSPNRESDTCVPPKALWAMLLRRALLLPLLLVLVRADNFALVDTFGSAYVTGTLSDISISLTSGPRNSPRPSCRLERHVQHKRLSAERGLQLAWRAVFRSVRHHILDREWHWRGIWFLPKLYLRLNTSKRTVRCPFPQLPRTCFLLTPQISISVLV